MSSKFRDIWPSQIEKSKSSRDSSGRLHNGRLHANLAERGHFFFKSSVVINPARVINLGRIAIEVIKKYEEYMYLVKNSWHLVAMNENWNFNENEISLSLHTAYTPIG